MKKKKVAKLLDVRPPQIPMGLRLEPEKSRRGSKKDLVVALLGRGTSVFNTGRRFDPFK